MQILKSVFFLLFKYKNQFIKFYKKNLFSKYYHSSIKSKIPKQFFFFPNPFFAFSFTNYKRF